jgi:hypothetical protein
MSLLPAKPDFHPFSTWQTEWSLWCSKHLK